MCDHLFFLKNEAPQLEKIQDFLFFSLRLNHRDRAIVGQHPGTPPASLSFCTHCTGEVFPPSLRKGLISPVWLYLVDKVTVSSLMPACQPSNYGSQGKKV